MPNNLPICDRCDELADALIEIKRAYRREIATLKLSVVDIKKELWCPECVGDRVLGL